MAANSNTIADEDGEFEDWIELYNAGAIAVNLDGWGLSKDPGKPFQWTFPSVTVQPGDYFLVWASGKDRKERVGEPAPPASHAALATYLEFHGSSGVNSGVTADEAFAGGERMSFAAWIYPASETPNQEIWYGDNVIGNNRWSLQYNHSGRNTDTNGFSMRNHGSPSFHWSTVSDQPPMQWYFVVWTYDADRDITRIYVNGERAELVGSASGANGVEPADGTDGITGGHPVSGGLQEMRLGFGGRNAANPFQGRIASAFLWNRFLEDDDVENLYADFGYAAELSDGAVLFWHIDEGSGNSLGDASSNNRSGTFTAGNPSWGPAVFHPHTNFRISADGDPIMLTHPGGVVVDAAPPRPGGRRMSVGRSPDGEGDWVYFMEPTPGASNDSATPYEDILDPPQFSRKRGWYDQPFELELVRSNEGSTLYYTLDGRHPAADNGIVYTGEPISINGISIVRAVEHKEGFVPSLSASHTYLFFDQVIAQSSNPEGWPSTWGLGGNDSLDGGKFQPAVQANYGLHPMIVSDPEYAQRFKKAFDEIPVISITMDPDDIFGEQYGILTYPDRFQSGVRLTRDQIHIVERPVSMEFFDRGSDEEFQIDAGMRIQGGSSTRDWKVLKLSKRLFFRADYGKTRLEHPFFPDSEVQSFRTLVLGAGHNLTWQHPAHQQRVMGQYVRDVFMPDLHRSMGSLSPHDRYVHVFLNGLYWGKYYVQNRPDATFMADNLGGSRHDYDVLRHDANTVVDGDTAAFHAIMNLASADLSLLENYEALGGMLDLAAFVDYMLFNFWAGNTDWPRHNWYGGRKREAGAKWRFFSWDAEHVLNNVNEAVPSGTSGDPRTIFNNLMASAEFRLLFGDRVRRHFFNGGIFEVDPTAPAGWAPHYPERNRPAHLYRKRIAEVDNSMALETARWGDTRPHPSRELYTRNEDWMNELNRLMNNYFPNRSGIVLNRLRSAGLYPSAASPVLEPHGGAVLDGLTVRMRAPSGTIHYTLNGEDPREYGTGQVSAGALAYGNEGVEITGARVIKARVRDANGVWSALTEAYYVEPPIKPYRLAQGPYVFHYWDPLAPAGTYPEGMIFEQAERSDPRLPAQLDGYWKLPYNLTSRSRINGLGYQGISFINTANAQDAEGAGHVGSAILALDTTGEENLYLQWTAGTVTPNERTHGLRLQYRVGGSGVFQDVMSEDMFPLEYRSRSDVGHAEVFGPVRLPGEMENRPYVELRWKYYHLYGGSGPRAELRLDNIVVTGENSGTGVSPVPPMLIRPIAFQELKEGAAPLEIDLSEIFSDSTGPVFFAAQSSNGNVTSVGISESILTVTPSQRGEATVTVYADDGHNPPTPTSFRVLVYPAAHFLANGAFNFDHWSDDEADGSYPEHMLFLQSNGSDTLIDTSLEYAYSLTEEEYHSDDRPSIGFPYNNTRRTRLNGLGSEGIAFINTGRDRDLGGALLAVNTQNVDFVRIGWLGGTVLPGNRVYAIRLQYRVGAKGEFRNVLDEEGEPVEYVRDDTNGHVQHMGPVYLPFDALGEEYVQLLWRYYKVFGESGPRAQLRLDEVVVSSTDPEARGFAAWQHEQFTHAELQEVSISGPLADPDGSGVQNLLRYSLGLDRYAPHVDAIPRVESTSEGMVLRFSRRISVESEVGFSIEWTGDPSDAGSWTYAEPGEAMVFLGASENADGLTEEVAYLLSPPVIALPRAFFRLRVMLGKAAPAVNHVMGASLKGSASDEAEWEAVRDRSWIGEDLAPSKGLTEKEPVAP